MTRIQHSCRAAIAGISFLAMTFAIPAAKAQSWEVGVVAGGGFYTKATATSPAGSADVGFKSGPVVGAIIGNDTSNRVGGELRYEWQPGDLRVDGEGQSATLKGESHNIHYDFLVYFAGKDSAIRPFVALGGGVKIFRGTGDEVAFQPLNRIALLTKTTETKGMGSVGAGIKVKISPRLRLRLEARDFITPFPKQVIAPSIDASIGDWLHDFVVMGGLTFVF